MHDPRTCGIAYCHACGKCPDQCHECWDEKEARELEKRKTNSQALKATDVERLVDMEGVQEVIFHDGSSLIRRKSGMWIVNTEHVQ